jgi:acetolactate synthase-1/2/3 large subunit
MKMTTLAAAVGRTVAENGVGQAFGVVGNGNIHVISGLVDAGVSYLSARHEGGAVTMADAYYRTTGEVAVCTTTYGPGLTNTATGLADAVKHRSGLLVLCGDQPTAGPRSIDIDQSAFVTALGAVVMRVTDPAGARAVTTQAVRVARTHQCPVVLCLPHDLMAAEVPDAAVAAGPREATRPAATAAELAAVVSALAGARRPLLLGGLGAWRSGAAKPLTDLAERVGALVTTTVMGDGLFSGNPWGVGICGGFSTPAAAALIGSADLVLAFGASLNEWTLDGGGIFAADATVVQVDVRAGVAVERVDLHVTADAASVASALLDAVNTEGLQTSAWREEAAPAIARVGWEHQAYADAGTAERIDPRTLSLALAGLMPEERTVVMDGGHFVGWPAMYWRVPDPAAMVFTGAAFQSIGLGFAGAAGAAAGRPDRLTVVALGDGGALMGLPELDTLIRTRRSVLVVVYDDAAYGFEVHLHGPRGTDVSSAKFTDTDFAGIARALGARAVTVRTVDDLAAVTAWRATGAPGTLVLDCKVVPEVTAAYLAGVGPKKSGKPTLRG